MEANLVIIAVEHQELRHSLRRVLSDRIERMLFADDAQSLLDTLALFSFLKGFLLLRENHFNWF